MALAICALVSSGMSTVELSESFTKETLLTPRRPARADDADNLFVTLGPDDEDHPATDRPDGNEPVFDFRMFTVEDLDVVPAGREELACFFERDAVLLLVCEVLGMAPRDLHFGSVSQWLSPSTLHTAVSPKTAVRSPLSDAYG